jgi:hypothetical protein
MRRCPRCESSIEDKDLRCGEFCPFCYPLVIVPSGDAGASSDPTAEAGQ